MSQILVCDHSTAGAIIGGTLRRDGYQGVVRYAAAGRGNVNITPAEIADLKANGVPVAIVVEHEADWLLHTASVAGRIVGARDITRACKLPDGVLYLACDFDAQGDATMQQIEASLNAAAAVVGRENVGFYGGYFAIEWLVQHGWKDINYWQTAAWSQGLLHTYAKLYQRASTATVAGVQVDVDVVLHPDWGQRTPAKKRHRVKLPKVQKPHIKVTTAGISGALTAGLLAYLNSHGVHVTHLSAGEASAISLVTAVLAAYFVPAK